jgi:hypothetical protein
VEGNSGRGHQQKKGTTTYPWCYLLYSIICGEVGYWLFLKCLVSIFQISVCLFGCDHPVTLPSIPPLTLPAFFKARKPLTRWCAQLPKLIKIVIDDFFTKKFEVKPTESYWDGWCYKSFWHAWAKDAGPTLLRIKMLKDGERSGYGHGYLWVWHSVWAWNSTILIGWCRVKSLIEDMSGKSALYKKSVTLPTDFCNSIQIEIIFYSKSGQVVFISWTYISLHQQH